MRLDFYYFSCQCPLNWNMLQLFHAYQGKIDVHLYDITNDWNLAERMAMFYPTLTVLNGVKRYYGPLSQSFLAQAALGKYPEEKPFIPALSDRAVMKNIEPLTLDNVSAACGCCGRKTAENCAGKLNFFHSFPQKVYGFLHRDEAGNLIGGAEYLPSAVVPYPVPRNGGTAFLTCLYLSDAEHDFKSAPLKALEQYLRQTYSRMLAISDEAGVFPNGNLNFFLRHGYRDEGVVFEDPHYCRLHLVSKQLC